MKNRLKEFVQEHFDSEEYEVRGSFPILYAGWDHDDEVIMIRVNNRIYAVGSDHGSPCLLSKQELLIKVQEYAHVSSETLLAAMMID